MMQVKRYIAPTFAEALIQAKNELGTEAMIVESKKLKIGGFMGFFQRQVTELTVAVDRPANGKPSAGTKPHPAAHHAAPATSPVLAAATAAAAPTQAQVTALQPMNLTNLEREMASLRTTVARLLERGLGPAPVHQLQGFSRKVFEELVERGVDHTAALDIGQRIRSDGPEGQEALRRELTRLIGPGAPIVPVPGERKVVALIGPTGVGKTTTLAKLAAQFTLERGMKIGLITSDTFRIAAIDQLRIYADILGVPMYAVDTPADAARALSETADRDLVLVDTGGRNHKDAQRMLELKELLSVLRPDETHLCFSLTANPKDVFDSLDYYLPMGVNRLTFTKLDEASAPGLMLNVRMRCNHPLSYVTHGQSVPDDLTPADEADFSKILMGA